MRKIGEGGFGQLAQAKKCPASLRKRNIEVKCDCGHIGHESEIILKKYHSDGYQCFDCRTKARVEGKKEIQAALIALAKRKGLI